MIPILIPFEQVGGFKLGSKISEYTDKFDFIFHSKEKEYQYDHYHLKDIDITLFVDNNIIESIACDNECIFKGRNLIGMNISEFISYTEEQYYGEIDELNYEEDNIPQFVYEFEDIGLQVWVKNEIVITVIASGDESD